MLLGTTYNQHEINHLKLDHTTAFNQMLAVKFDIVRLGVYWNEVQPTKDAFDLSAIQSMLAQCEQSKQNVLLVVGMKAPRWPEFYIPKWLKTNNPADVEVEVLAFIDRTITQLRKFDCIFAWQVENEPLDPSGPHHHQIPSDLLRREVSLVRAADPSREVHVTAWGNELTKRQNLPELLELGDSVGLDIYYKTPVWGPLYAGPRDSDKKLSEIISSSPKPIWITELQAEAWERQDKDKWQAYPGSINPGLLRKNFDRAVAMNPAAILLWGYEYWLWHKQRGRPELWDTAASFIVNRGG